MCTVCVHFCLRATRSTCQFITFHNYFSVSPLCLSVSLPPSPSLPLPSPSLHLPPSPSLPPSLSLPTESDTTSPMDSQPSHGSTNNNNPITNGFPTNGM